MSNLNKSTVGLGKVINRLQSDGSDFNLLQSRLDSLMMTNYIEGNWNNITNSSLVSSTNGMDYEINLDKNKGVTIIVNASNKYITLKGGLNGRSFYFVFKNLGDHIVLWNNVRCTNAEAPYLTNGNSIIPGVTTMTIVKMGDEYYITDVNNNVMQ